MKKKVLAIYINEFNYEFIDKGAKKYKCKSISKIFNKKKIITYTKDKIQNKNLDPWVQNVSINTGNHPNRTKFIIWVKIFKRNKFKFGTIYQKKK